MTLQHRITALAQAVGADIGAIEQRLGVGVPALQPLLIYYGYPIAYKRLWNTATVIAEIAANFSYWVVGHTYQDPSHEEYASTVTIIQGVRAAGVKVYGYIALGTSNYNYTVEQIGTITDQWSAIGIDGVFLDEYGFDYGNTRQRQVDVVNAIHAKGLPICANAWVFEEFVSDTLAETGWVSGDWKYTRWQANNPTDIPAPHQEGDSYLIENFCYSHTGPSVVWDTQERCLNTRTLATSKGVELWAEAVFGETTPGTLDVTKIGKSVDLEAVGAYISANAFLYDISIVGSGGYSFGSNGSPLWALLYQLPASATLPTAPATNNYSDKTGTRYFGTVRVQVINTDTVQSVSVESTEPAVLGQIANPRITASVTPPADPEIGEIWINISEG